MKGKLSYLILFVSLILNTNITAQVGINSDGSAPDASAMLDVKSGDKGILIPRMDDAAMNAIASPADGLLIYNTTKADFYYYHVNAWQPIGSTVDDHDWTVNGNDMYSAVSGNVGIGNNAPEFKLDVNGDIRHGNKLYLYSNSNNGYQAWAQFNSPDNGYGDNIFLGAGGTTVIGSGESASYTRNNIDTTNGHETFYLTSDDNFGLYTNMQNGWDDKTDALLIDRDRDWHMDFTNIYIHDISQDNNRVRFISRTNYHYGYGMSIAPGQGLAIGGGESAQKVFSNIDLSNNEVLYLSSDTKDANQAIKFITNMQDNWNDRVEAVTILGNGKVGVGLTNPVGTLHIAHTNDAGPNGVGNAGSDLVIGDTNGQHLEVDDNEIHSMNGIYGSTLYLNIDGGRVEVGSHHPTTLDINALLHLRPSPAPSSPQEGDIYMDNNTHKLRCYDGNAWHDLW